MPNKDHPSVPCVQRGGCTCGITCRMAGRCLHDVHLTEQVVPASGTAPTEHQSEPTKGPWSRDDAPTGQYAEQIVATSPRGLKIVVARVAGGYKKRGANAAHIVRCVNSHADLLAALEEAETALMRCEFAGAKAMDGGMGAIDSALIVVRAALSKAKP